MTEEYYPWAKMRWIVLFRDRFTCQKCGIKGQFSLIPWMRPHPKGEFCDLEVHHVLGRDEKEGWLFSSLVSLCSACHIEAHNGNWKTKPTEKFATASLPDDMIHAALADYYERRQTLGNLRLGFATKATAKWSERKW